MIMRPIYHSDYKKQGHDKSRVPVFWRSGRDSNPRGIAPKLISSQPRYDHFDTAANIKCLRTLLALLLPRRRGSPVMSCCGAQNFFPLSRGNFDRCHSFLLAPSATGGARKRPHFDTAAYLIIIPHLSLPCNGKLLFFLFPTGNCHGLTSVVLPSIMWTTNAVAGWGVCCPWLTAKIRK